MSSSPWSLKDSVGPRPSANDIIADHRARILMEENERQQKRQIQLADQRSIFNSPDARIRAWETVHGLRLPPNPSHPVLNVIATDTGLTVLEVQEEQRARLARAAVRTA